MRRFALSYYLTILMVALCLFASLLNRVGCTSQEVLLFVLLFALVGLAVITAWRASGSGK